MTAWGSLSSSLSSFEKVLKSSCISINEHHRKYDVYSLITKRRSISDRYSRNALILFAEVLFHQVKECWWNGNFLLILDDAPHRTIITYAYSSKTNRFVTFFCIVHAHNTVFPSQMKALRPWNLFSEKKAELFAKERWSPLSWQNMFITVSLQERNGLIYMYYKLINIAFPLVFTGFSQLVLRRDTIFPKSSESSEKMFLILWWTSIPLLVKSITTENLYNFHKICESSISFHNYAWC